MKTFLKKIQSHKVLLFFFSIATTSLAAVIIWPILDFLYSSFIVHTTFVYSPFDHILMPIIVCATIDIVLFVPTIALEKIPRKSKKTEKSKKK